MDTKEYLNQVRNLDKRINLKLKEKETLKDLRDKITVNAEDEKVSGTKDKDSLEKTIIKLVDLEKEINKDIDKLVDLRNEIRDVINKVNDFNNQLILEMRYIGGKSWDEIAMFMEYDRRTVFRFHGKALKEVEKIIK